MQNWHAETVSETAPHYGVCEEGSNQPRALVWTAEDARMMAAAPALTAALDRADRLIEWMSGYIGKMAPGSYGDCYVDLNAHGLALALFRSEGLIPAKKEG